MNEYLDIPKPRQVPTGGRLIYRPSDVFPWITGKTVALIGDSPTKRKYIYAPDRVIGIALNKAAIWYPRDFAAVVECHFDEIMVQLPAWIPILYLGSVDIRRYNIGPGLWSMVVLIKMLNDYAGKVYLQGFGLTEKKYKEQVDIVAAMIGTGTIDQNKFVAVGEGCLADLFENREVDPEDIC